MTLIGEALVQGLVGGGAIGLAQAGILKETAALHGGDAVEPAKSRQAQPGGGRGG